MKASGPLAKDIVIGAKVSLVTKLELCLHVLVNVRCFLFSLDIQSSKHKDRRKGSLDVRSTTSRGSDGESEGR